MLFVLLTELDGLEDKARFTWIYTTLRHKMYRVALSLLRDPEDAQEAVQESFEKMIRKFSKISALPHKEIEPYVVTIAENTARDMLRKKRRQPATPLEDAYWQPPAREDTESQNRFEQMVELILQMPDHLRDVLYLACVEEETRQGTARRLGLTQGQVTGRLHRGRKLLQDRLREEGYVK